ncbi:neuropeptide F isoform X1 [Drosophila takahashii]|uniref:neuropeptide F isoform X1 n=1 Tax=Drosophila takahashii TaxID=29030 RepID=UPI001CF8D590|nr:neuropeptide F isoform X1 [Drosophila takahashii]
MCQTMRCILIVCVALALLAAGCRVEASNSRPPRKNDVNTMADAYKFLQDLDTYYGDRARVRFGKRGALMEILRNREMDNFNLGKSASNGGELVRALDEEEVY